MAHKVEFTTLIFTFPKPLNPYQTNCFRANLGNMGEQVEAKIQKIVAAIDANPGFKLAPADTMAAAAKVKLLGVSRAVKQHARLRQRTKTIWTFTYPSEKVSFANLRLPLNQNLKLDIITPGMIVGQLKEHVFPALTKTGYHGMGIEPIKMVVKVKMMEVE